MTAPPGAIVDNSDPAIRYSEGWIANTSVSVGPNGQIPLYNSLHVTQSNSNFSFSFNGSFVSVSGLMLPSTQLPTWQCIIDGVKVLASMFNDGEEHLPLCSQSLGDGYHTITVAVNATQDSPFCLDYIQYQPTSTGYTDSIDKIYTPDAVIGKTGDWSPLPSIRSGIMTRDKNSKLQIQFNGVSLTWLGVYNNSISGPSTTATYTINGTNPIPFPINNFASNYTPVILDQIILQTMTYPRGLHNLEVTYEGDSLSAPLTLTSFVVQNIPESRGTVINLDMSSAIPSPTSSASSSGKGYHSHSSEIIVGGIIGGVLLLIIVLLCVTLWRRRNLKYGVELFDTPVAVRPFDVPPCGTFDSFSPAHMNSKASSPEFTTSPRGRVLPSTKIHDGITSTPTPFRNTPYTPLRPSASSLSPEIRIHQDSGLRLSQPEDASNVIDIPPLYSPV